MMDEDKGMNIVIILILGFTLFIGFMIGSYITYFAYKDEVEKRFEQGFMQGQIEASEGNWKYKQVEVKTWVKNKEEVK